MMAAISEQSDPLVVLYGVPGEMYEGILRALGEHHLRHTYDRGTLELPALLYGVEWKDYKALLEALGDFNLRHTYDRGTLEMMSPRKDHDWVKKIIARMIESLATALRLPIQSIGSTTLTGDGVERGLQPDEAYYIASESLVRGKRMFEPGKDPPPDLVIEVDVTHSSIERLPLFAALGIPEVWRYDGKRLRFYRLSRSGKRKGDYREVSRSVAFEFLTPTDLTQFIDRLDKTDETSLVCAFVEHAVRLAEQSSR